MDLENTVKLDNSIKNNITIEQTQNNFLENKIGKLINEGIDFGLRAILPDFIEDQVINIKNNLLNFGLKDGIPKIIDDTINFGKKLIGVPEKEFESVNQMQDALKNGNISKNLSEQIDKSLELNHEKGNIELDTINNIKNDKNVILNTVEENVEKFVNNQYQVKGNLEKYINTWKNGYESKDFTSMDKQYKKIKKELKNLLPLENLINEAREIETIHMYIKNNGKNFDISDLEKDLINKLN